MKIVEHELQIPSDYQYKALREGGLLQRQWHRNRLLLVKNINFLSENDDAADIGCGSGNIVLVFSGKTKTFTGLDYNQESLDFLKGKVGERGIGNVNVNYFDLLNSDFSEFKGKFDKIILNEVIEHFEEEEVDHVMSNLHGLLKDGGEILITTPNYVSAWPVMEFLADKFKIFPTLWGEQHKIKFTRKLLRNYCEKHDYEVMEMGTFGLISPFAIILSRKLADKFMELEARHLSVLGPQLFVRIRNKK
ncbi:class I SAM-dependent methyltransferase [Patescibacteria group bacterium]